MTTGITTKKMYKQGDIVIVPFPFEEDQTKNKFRPVVIMSKGSVNKEIGRAHV